ncbi:amidohydrolase family protein, partial [Kitasatospora sp. NPDC001539]
MTTADRDRTALAGARIVLPGGVVEGGRLTVEGERIASVTGGTDGTGSTESAAEPGDLDLTGCTVVPGFVDLHVHGGGGASYASGIAEEALLAARTHLAHGTTTTVASTVTGEIDELARQAHVLSELVEDGILAGIHFEGPFISHHRCGAHRPDLLRDPDPALVRKLVDAA